MAEFSLGFSLLPLIFVRFAKNEPKILGNLLKHQGLFN
jgi:hypothetical protein